MYTLYHRLQISHFHFLLAVIFSLVLVWSWGTEVRAETIASPVETESTMPTVFLFGREDCGFCKAERVFLDAQSVPYTYLNVVDDPKAKELFLSITKKHDLSKVTPITVIGSTVLQGFGGEDTTGQQLLTALEKEVSTPYTTIEEHIAFAPVQSVASAEGCDDSVICDTGVSNLYVFDLPLIGVVDFKEVSLFTLSAVLGVVDGFNPCAMWVLVTFLVLLTQAGSKKKMVIMAGLFIAAEAIMYNLILNVWYKAWDFVALDQIVTPVVGLLALGGGIFFLYRWRKNKDLALVCDVSSLDQQTKTIARFKKIVEQPLTIATVLAILVIAFSVNIIEFACSIGIPQAYTKILELNVLSFTERQFYILIYTIGYMLDDFIVFGLAIWGFSKLAAHGHKYSQLSLMIGGVLMLVLGVILVFAPSLLVL